jgi:hypothetical protein
LSHLVIDDLGDIAAWRARTPGGAASSELAVEAGTMVRLGAPTLRIAGTIAASGHRAERTFGAVDLTGLDDLRLWIRSDRPADGSAARPFFLEVRLGSGQLAVGAQGNGWHRLLPVPSAGVWHAVPLALDDLPAAVRTAASAIRLTCVDAGAPFVVHLAALVAARDEMLADADAALAGRLDAKVEVGGVSAPAIVEPDAAPNPPFLRVRNYGVRPAPERSPSGGSRTDYTEHGFSIRPPSLPFDVLYEVEAVADSRGDAATMLEFVLRELTPLSTLDAGGRPLTVEWIEPPPLSLDATPAHPTVHLKVSTSQRAAAAGEAAVPPFNRIDVEVDSRATA